jgi:hypothetical protein
MMQNEQVTVRFIRAVCGSSGEGPQHCDVCGGVITVGNSYIRRVLPATGNVRIYCADCERFRLVDLPIMPERVEPQPFLPE